MRVEFKDVSFKRRFFALQNLSFEIREGYITGLLGKNGAGKTTLMKLLVDEKAKYTGTILVDGKDLRQCRSEILQKVGFVTEDMTYVPYYTVLNYGKLLGSVYDDFSEDAFVKYLQEMGISGGKKIENMSRGELLKFQLALAMAHGSRLFVLDEVTAGMDVVFKKDFFAVLHRILEDEGCTVMMSTHIMEEVEQHMDYVLRIEDGKLTDYYEVGKDGEK